MEFLLIVAVVVIIIVVSKKRKTAKIQAAQEALEQLIYQADKTNSDELRQRLLNEQKSYGFTDDQMYQIRKNFYIRKAQSGDLFAQYQLGRYSLLEKKPSEALQWLTKAAQGGYPEALYQLGLRYKQTFNTETSSQIGFGYDSVKSFQYFLKAAEAGHTEAMCNLAYCYEEGEGINADPEKAIFWLKKGVSLRSWRCANYLAQFCYSSPIHPLYNLEAALALHRQSISYARDREDFSETLQAMGMIYGGCYIYGGEETPLSDRKKATYCFIMADLADSARNNRDIVQKIGYNYSNQELTMLQNDVRNMRISF